MKPLAFSILIVWLFGLDLAAQEPKLVLPIGHSLTINTAFLSPDGKKILTASDDRTAKLWDAETGFLLVTLTGHSNRIVSAVFSPDGKKIVTASDDHTAKVWDAETGKLLASLQSHAITTKLSNHDVSIKEDAFFSPDGNLIVTISNTGNSADNSVKIWDVNRNYLPVSLQGIAKDVLSALFSADGQEILTVSFGGGRSPAVNNATGFVLRQYFSGSISLWSSRDGSLIFEKKINDSFPVQVKFSADNTKIIGRCTDSLIDSTFTDRTKTPPIATIANLYQSIKTWDAKNGKLLNNQRMDNSIIVSDDGKVGVIDIDNNAKIRNAEKIIPLVSAKTKTLKITSATFSPDDKKLITTSEDSAMLLWNVDDGKLIAQLNASSHTIHLVSGSYRTATSSFVEFSGDSKKILTLSGDDIVQLWDATNGIMLTNLSTHAYAINSSVFSPDDKRILTSETDKTAKVWDVETGTLIHNLKGHSDNVISAVYSPDGRKIVTASWDKTAKIWDAGSGKLLNNLNKHTAKVNSATFSPDGTKIITASLDHSVKLWDASSGEIIATGKQDVLGTISDSEWGLNSAVFSPDGKKVLAASGDGRILIWDWAKGVKIFDLAGWKDGYTSAIFSPDNTKMVATNDWESPAKLSKFLEFVNMDYRNYDWTEMWDANTGQRLEGFKGHLAGLNSLVFSPNGFWLVTACMDSTAKVWDVYKNQLIATLSGHKDKVSSACFSPDGKKILTTSLDGSAKLWRVFLDSLREPIDQYPPELLRIITSVPNFKRMSDTIDYGKTPLYPYGEKSLLLRMCANWTLLADLNGHTGPVKSAIFSSNGKKITTISRDNTSKVWDAESGKLLYTFFAIDSTDYFDQIPNGYYKCTPKAAKMLHYVTKNLEIITFDQLDIKYNRPDKVLQAIGCQNKTLIGDYLRAYEKRIKILGIDTNSFSNIYSLPKSDFKNRDDVAYEQKQDKLAVRIFGSDSAYVLDRFNVWVNQVPIYGVRGINLRKKSKQSIDTVITLTLSPGINRIETAVTDANGTESYHMPLYVKYEPVSPVDSSLYFIGIGGNKFADASEDLNWSAKDIRDLASAFKKKYGNKCIIDTLLNKNATVANIEALKKKLMRSSVNDRVIIAFSGHGVVDKNYNYFLSTYDMNFEAPSQNGLLYDKLENLLDGIPARKKLLLIDACNSGEFDKEEMRTNAKGRNSSAASSFELMRSLFVNVNKGTGSTVISASSGRQFAMDGVAGEKNGVFTFSILEKMRMSKHIAMSELKKYVSKRVTQLSHNNQTPTIRNETDFSDWQIW